MEAEQYARAYKGDNGGTGQKLGQAIIIAAGVAALSACLLTIVYGLENA